MKVPIFHVYLKRNNMTFTSYTQTDAYYEFVGDEGKLIVPSTDVVLVDDESGFISIKNTASRCTVGLLKIVPPPPQRAWLATYADSSTESGDCESSHGVIFQDSITKNNLVSVVIDDCVNMLLDDAFGGCGSLTSVTFGSGVTSIERGAFRACTILGSIEIPSGVTSICEHVFETCISLTSVTIPNSVTSIGRSAFSNCFNLNEIAIPSGVTSIGDYAFRNCDRLEFVVVNATTPPTLGSNVFDGTYNLVIYVPAASVSAYQSAWSDYASNIQGR